MLGGLPQGAHTTFETAGELMPLLEPLGRTRGRHSTRPTVWPNQDLFGLTASLHPFSELNACKHSMLPADPQFLGPSKMPQW